MPALTFTFVVIAISGLAGFLGALTGLGGGVVIVPALTLLLGVDIKYAIGASLVSVIATSSGAAAAYVREGFTNIRIGMLLEIATTLGALIGALIASHVSTHIIAIIFGLVLAQAAWQSFRAPEVEGPQVESDALSTRLRLGGDFPVGDRRHSYGVRNVPAGFGLMFGAGALSGLLGIGSGALKVIAMDRLMRIPFKVSTTTSNFMIGVTASASAGAYLLKGDIRPEIAAPVSVGIIIGSFIGAKVMMKMPAMHIRRIFVVVLIIVSVQMLMKGWST